jgi:quercetin dioxygenase-like cupin family protein
MNLQIVEKSPRLTEGVNDFLGQVHHFSDGLYAKQLHIPANYVIGSHSHKYNHLSILAQGEVVVFVDDKQTRFVAPACIEIAAGKEHRVFAVTDSVWYCVHATTETDVDKIDEVLVSEGA